MRHTIRRYIASCFLVGLLLAPAQAEAPQKRVLLITAEEAAAPNRKPVHGMGRTVEPSDGPIVEFVAPKDGETVNKPVQINVIFKPKDAPVNLDSLQVTYLKLFDIDITDRVRPFATAEGIHIQEADLPSGSHHVRFSIKDSNGQLTERTLAVTIE